MEINFFSTQLNGRERFFSQSVLLFFLAVGLSLWGSLIVFADPLLKVPEKNSRVPLAERVFESSGEWRALKESKDVWRKPKSHELTIQNDRIQKKKPPFYNSTEDRSNWDPYAFPESEDIHNKPATLFKFRF